MNLLFVFINALFVIFLYSLNGDFGLTFSMSNDLAFSLRQTPVGTFFAYITFVSFFLVAISQKKEKLSFGYYMLELLLSVSMFIIVFAGDFIAFFMGWEVMTISSYFLISQSKNIDKKTLQKYILFSLGSAFFLIAGMVLLYSGVKSFDFIVASKKFYLLDTWLKVAIITLFSISFFIKTGVIGLHYWVVDTYSKANDTFSAILSAVMSKMGIYGLFLIYGEIVGYNNLKEIFGALLNGSTFGYALAWIGVITSIIATFKAITQDEVKRLLAYSSIAQLGYILSAIGLGVEYGVAGALYHTLLHTIIKLLLFINVAAIIAHTGKSRFSELGGLIYKTPVSFVMLLIGIIALAGMPPLGGFASKFMIYSSLIETKFAIVLVAMLFSGAASFLYCYKLVYGIYLGHPNSPELFEQKEVGFSYLLPQVILSLFLLLIGTFPGMFVKVINPVIREFHLSPIPYKGAGVMPSFIGDFNGLFIMSTFGVIFVLVLALVLVLNSKAVKNRDRFDISYCGEVPTGNTPLHYGYGVGAEIHRIKFVNMILKRTVSNFYEFLATQTAKTSELFSKMYRGNIHNTAIVILLFFSLLYFLGVDK